MFIFLNIICIFIVFFIGADILSLADEMVYCRATGTELLQRKYSTCKNCGHRLRLKDTFPVVSRFVNKGICRFCDEPFAKRDFNAQVIGGMIAVIIYVLLNFVVKLSVLPTILIMTVLLVIGLIITVRCFESDDKKNNREYKLIEIDDENEAEQKADKEEAEQKVEHIGLINIDDIVKK